MCWICFVLVSFSCNPHVCSAETILVPYERLPATWSKKRIKPSGMWLSESNWEALTPFWANLCARKANGHSYSLSHGYMWMGFWFLCYSDVRMCCVCVRLYRIEWAVVVSIYMNQRLVVWLFFPETRYYSSQMVCTCISVSWWGWGVWVWTSQETTVIHSNGGGWIVTVAETSGCHKFLSPSNSKGFLFCVFVTSPMRKTSTLDARVRFSKNVVRYVRREVYTVQSGGLKLESESGGSRLRYFCGR